MSMIQHYKLYQMKGYENNKLSCVNTLGLHVSEPLLTLENHITGLR